MDGRHRSRHFWRGRDRTRRTGRLVRHALLVLLVMVVTWAFVRRRWWTVVDVGGHLTARRRPIRPIDGPAEIISPSKTADSAARSVRPDHVPTGTLGGSRSWWLRRESVKQTLTAEAGRVREVAASRLAGFARPGRAWVVKVERPAGRTTFATQARSGGLWRQMASRPSTMWPPGGPGPGRVVLAAGGRIRVVGPEALPAGGSTLRPLRRPLALLASHGVINVARHSQHAVLCRYRVTGNVGHTIIIASHGDDGEDRDDGPWGWPRRCRSTTEACSPQRRGNHAVDAASIRTRAQAVTKPPGPPSLASDVSACSSGAASTRSARRRETSSSSSMLPPSCRCAGTTSHRGETLRPARLHVESAASALTLASARKLRLATRRVPATDKCSAST